MQNLDQDDINDLSLLQDPQYSNGLNDEDARTILLVKHNDEDTDQLVLEDVVFRVWSDAARLLGVFIGQNTNLMNLTIHNCNLDVVDLCDGLKHNRCIRQLRLSWINLRDTAKLNSLAPFFIKNTSLEEIHLTSCNLWPNSMWLLSHTLSNLSGDTLKTLNLSGNNLGGADLNILISVLITSCRGLKSFMLNNNEISLKGCRSLAKLLESPEPNLECLYLHNNSLNNKCADILVDALASNSNSKLKYLNLLGNSNIRSGWSALLDLVCNTSSTKDIVESNHTLEDLNLTAIGPFSRPLMLMNSIDDRNLLHACLKLNKSSRSIPMIIKQKIIWGLVKGDLNIEDHSIPTVVIPTIMAWFSSSKTGTKIQYHNPPLSQEKLDIARINTVYHIFKSMPYLVSEASLPHYRMRKLRYTFMVVIFGLLLLYYGLVINKVGDTEVTAVHGYMLFPQYESGWTVLRKE